MPSKKSPKRADETPPPPPDRADPGAELQAAFVALDQRILTERIDTDELERIATNESAEIGVLRIRAAWPESVRLDEAMTIIERNWDVLSIPQRRWLDALQRWFNPLRGIILTGFPFLRRTSGVGGTHAVAEREFPMDSDAVLALMYPTAVTPNVASRLVARKEAETADTQADAPEPPSDLITTRKAVTHTGYSADKLKRLASANIIHRYRDKHATAKTTYWWSENELLTVLRRERQSPKSFV